MSQSQKTPPSSPTHKVFMNQSPCNLIQFRGSSPQPIAPTLPEDGIRTYRKRLSADASASPEQPHNPSVSHSTSDTHQRMVDFLHQFWSDVVSADPDRLERMVRQAFLMYHMCDTRSQQLRGLPAPESIDEILRIGFRRFSDIKKQCEMNFIKAATAAATGTPPAPSSPKSSELATPLDAEAPRPAKRSRNTPTKSQKTPASPPSSPPHAASAISNLMTSLPLTPALASAFTPKTALPQPPNASITPGDLYRSQLSAIRQQQQSLLQSKQDKSPAT